MTSCRYYISPRIFWKKKGGKFPWMGCYFQLCFRTIVGLFIMARIHHLNCPHFLGRISVKTLFRPHATTLSGICRCLVLEFWLTREVRWWADLHLSFHIRFGKYSAPINAEVRLAALHACWISCRVFAAGLGTRIGRPCVVPQRAWCCSSLIKLLPSDMWLDTHRVKLHLWLVNRFERVFHTFSVNITKPWTLNNVWTALLFRES
jgi:hypothetical protein